MSTIDEAMAQALAAEEGLNGEWIKIERYSTKEYYSDTDVSIDMEKRTIGDISSNVSTAGEDNAQYISFIMDRYIDGVDLVDMTIQIQADVSEGASVIDGPVNAYYNESKIRFGYAIPSNVAYQATTVKIIVFCTGVLPDGNSYTIKTLPVLYTISDTLNIGGSIPQPDENWYLQFVRTMDEKVTMAVNSANAAERSATEANESLSTVQAIQEDVNTSKGAVQTLAAQVQGNATKAQTSADAAKVSEQNAEQWFNKAKEHSGINYGSKQSAGIVAPQDVYVDPENGHMSLITQTSKKVLINSYPGKIKINEFDGNTEQFTTTGKNLFLLESPTKTMSGISITNNGNQSFSASGTATQNASFGLSNIESFSELFNNGFTGVLSLVNAIHDANTCNVSITYRETEGGTIKYMIPNKPITVPSGSIIHHANFYVPGGVTVNLLNVRVQLELGEKVTEWEPCTGGISSPNPNYQQEIKSVKGKNLLDCRGLTEQTIKGVTFTPVYDSNGNLQYIETNGKATGDSYLYVKDSFDFLKGESYVLSGCPSGGSINTFFMYGHGIEPMDYGTGATLNFAESKTTSIIIGIKTGYTADHLRFYPMIRPASITDSTYVPYGLLRIKVSGKNLFKQLCVPANPNAAQIHYLKAGTYSVTRDSSENGNNWYIGAYDSNGTAITKNIIVVDGWSLNSTEAYYYGGAENDSFTFTLNKNCYVDIASLNGKGTTYLMIVEGSEPAPYEPYQEKSIILSNPITLNGHNGVQDRIVRKDGVWRIERRFLIDVLDGLEIWFKQSTNRFITSKLKGVIKPTVATSEVPKMLCSHSIVISAGDTYRQNNGISVDSTGQICLYDTKFAEKTEEELKEYLASNPRTLLYEANEPTFEPLPTADQIALNSLVSFDGVTYLHFDSEIEPTSLVEYGTSKVGAYTLECYNDKEIMKIEFEAMKAAQVVTEEVVE